MGTFRAKRYPTVACKAQEGNVSMKTRVESVTWHKSRQICTLYEQLFTHSVGFQATNARKQRIKPGGRLAVSGLVWSRAMACA